MNFVETRRSHNSKNQNQHATKPALPAPENAGRRNHWRTIPTCAVALGYILAIAGLHAVVHLRAWLRVVA